jgi:Zn-dependent protease
VDFSEKELKDLTISAVVLALAFAIMFEGGFSGIAEDDNPLASLSESFLMSMIAICLGFVLHELGHRFVARRFDCVAQYEMWPIGLVMALAFSLFGFVLAAPGAVMIRPKMAFGYYVRLDKRKLGLISVTGPAMNLCLAIVFLALYSQYSTVSFWQDVFFYGAIINVILAGFNLIPFGPFDGKKIIEWDWRVWAITLASAGALFVAVNLVDHAV